ncbi:Transmembrane protease serine 3 [Entomophthora muscae]|uniref:Transmembrane protease serine 3 n=2 Tax=Entomophthora muscae TaxID=34485 RepID=A0ACC2SJC5_9FUNG|nr:Transmembrane protease serine 3 [Entomophthora muscae]KAJ9074416.1 Transmembrane protease serine 3 [Entomophthora muscae]
MRTGKWGMKHGLVFALLSGFAYGHANVTMAMNRIVGGNEVTPPFKYPWMVSLKRTGRHWCGGALYTPNTVISAAHCVADKMELWTVEVHRHNLKASMEQENGISYRVIDRIVHSSYKKTSNAYDIAIWKTDAPPRFVAFFRLDDGKWSSSSEQPLVVIGWGTTSSGGAASPQLREVVLPLIDDDVCKRAYPGVDARSQFCAGFLAGGRDSCQGDSGGPIVTSDGQYAVLVGVVSWGKGCAQKNYPGVYTRISSVIGFILKHTQ